MEVKLTRRGRRAWKAGLDGLSPGATLAMEIMTRVKHAELENVNEMITELSSAMARRKTRSLPLNPARWVSRK